MYRTYLLSGLLLATTCFAQVPSTTLRLQALTRQAEKLLNQDHPDSTWEQVFRQGNQLLNQLPDTARAAIQFRALRGTFYLHQHHGKAAINEYRTLIQLSQKIGDRTLENKARYRLTHAYSDLGMYQACITQSLANLRVFKQLHQHDMVANTYMILSWVYEQQGDLKQSSQCTWAGITYCRRVNTPMFRVLALLSESELYAKEKQYDKAIKIHLTALPQLKATPALYANIPAFYQTLTNLYYQTGRYVQALRVARAGLAQCRQQKNILSAAEIYLTIASLYAARGNNKASLAAAARALPLASRGGMVIVRRQTLDQLSAAQERVGDTKAALKTTRQLMALTDSLNQINKADAIASAEARFDVQTKNATIGLLNKNLLLRQQQARQEQQTASLIILFLAVGLCVLAFAWYKARQTGRLLRQQKTEIEAQARQLANVNKVKDQLFSIVSHDLRGPVVSLRQSLDRLEQASPATVSATLSQFRQSTNALASLTDNLLCWALSQLNSLRTRPQVFDLGEALSHVLTLYEDSIRQKNLHVSLDQPLLTNQALILADDDQTEIVLRNIIQNAIKFSPVGGRIRLRTEPHADQIVLFITDDGPGFDWQAGQQAVSQNSTGLGLAVVSTLMYHNRGSVQLIRRTDGPGTVARLCWPTTMRPAAITMAIPLQYN